MRPASTAAPQSILRWNSGGAAFRPIEQETADAAGVSRRLVNLLEGGRHPNAEVWRVLALLNALDVPLRADLVDDVSSVPPLGPIANQDDIDLDAYLATFRPGVSRT